MFQCHIFFSYCSWGIQGNNAEVVCTSFSSGHFCQNSPPWPIRLGRPHRAWLLVSLKYIVLWSMWSFWLVFWDCGFLSVCPLMHENKRLVQLPDGRDCLWGKSSLASMGRAMLSKSLIQFSADGWGCAPSLYFGPSPHYGRGNGNLLQKNSCQHTASPSAAAVSAPGHRASHRQPRPSPESSKHSQASVAQSLVGLLLLSPGSWSTQGFVCALKHLWRVWGLILNTIGPLLPSWWGCSFVLGCGVSFLVGSNIFLLIFVQQLVTSLVFSQEKISTCPFTLQSWSGLNHGLLVNQFPTPVPSPGVLGVYWKFQSSDHMAGFLGSSPYP